jgi:gluconate 2-dehydrogenase alpha chain
VKVLPRVDVAIAGGGWAGLLMAKELGARTGLSVVVLERGEPRNLIDYFNGMDELDYAIRHRMAQDASRETVTFRNASRDRALPVRQFASFLPGNGVGGAGEHWNGMTPRFLPDCFEIHTRSVERYGAGRLPANHSLQDWGLTYAELEPFYTRAEKLLGISGHAGSDPFEGRRSAEYPTPPQKMAYFPALFNDAARSVGYHPFPSPSANLSQAYRNPDGVLRPACQYCGFCERFGCMVGAKAQPTNTLLPVIAQQKGVTVRTGANVRRVIYKGGKATGVSYVDSKGEVLVQPAELVVLASWTINNTRLLLLSKVGEAYDARSGKGQVGRNFTHQVMSGVALFFDRPLNRFMGSGACGATIHDLNADCFDHGPLDFLRGASISAVALGYRPIGNFGAVPPAVKANWGTEWKKAAIDAFDSTASLSISGEHLAYSTNYLDLDPTYRDSLGDPLLRMTMDWNDNERNMIGFVSAKAAQVGREMGAREVVANPMARHYDVNSYKSTHLQGGTIMGANPGNSVVNPWLQHWQMPNLFVLGASTFPQNASGNPTLTILAQTLRTADAIVDRYLKRPGPLA